VSPYSDLLAALERAIPYARSNGEPWAWLETLEHTRDVTRAKHDKEDGA